VPGAATPDDAAMGWLVVVALFVALAVLTPLYGVDSRASRDAQDRYWWPDG
jgi:hypothetical protein